MKRSSVWAFWPIQKGMFLNWDDGVDFLENFNFRGLGWSQPSWMWTTFHMGHYQPLSWCFAPPNAFLHEPLEPARMRAHYAQAAKSLGATRNHQ